MKNNLFLIIVLLFSSLSSQAQKVIWEIGKSDNNASEFALGPNEYKRFLEKDFGYEDRYFLIGKSDIKKEFPYIIPGPNDTWGGTWGTSGWRTHEVNILFGLKSVQNNQKWKLLVDVLDNQKAGSLVKITVNNKSQKFKLDAGGSDSTALGYTERAKEQLLSIDLDAADMKAGGNKVSITVLEGAWIIFDQVKLLGPDNAVLNKPKKAFIRNVEAANYELHENGKKTQPLLVDVEHLDNHPRIDVEIDGKKILSAKLDTTRYILEAPMNAVTQKTKSKYRVLVDGKLEEEGYIYRDKQKVQTLADYVDTKMGTAHSRWMIAPGPWMPFSMVKISPDNQNAGWQAGYQPTFESVGTFSHIHEWTMAGLGMMPVNGPLKIKVGDERDSNSGYRSNVDKSTEEAPLGKYSIQLADYDIKAEVTATTRCSFSRYTYPSNKNGRVMIDLHIPAEYDYLLQDAEINKVSDYRIEGRSHQISPRPHVWSNDADQEYVVNFVIEFDKPIKYVGGWINDDIQINAPHITGKNIKNAGMFVEFDTTENNVVQARTGISLVSIENAAENLHTEITKPFGWSFEAVEKNQMDVWNNYFSRLQIKTDDRIEKIRFYSNMYRAICSRNTWSDVNGDWISPDETKQNLGNPEHVALGCDAFWNTFWNLNQFWNLVTPEWSSKWVNSQLAMYDANGWLAKGPAGMEYIPVMVAEHEIPLIVGAYQMGIRDFDSEKAFEAMNKMQTTEATQVAGGFAGNRDLTPYLKYKYVPTDKGRFSNTLEYSYDDWTVGQYAKALGKEKEYEYYNDRGYWWKNAFEVDSGYAHLKNSKGEFERPFNPFHSGKNHHYVEGNSWQLSYFVPQDVPALANMMGKKNFIDRLEWGFSVSEPWRYNAPNDQYWDYPVVQGNQQSMHFAFLFNWVGTPWLTQRWSRSIVDRYYGSGIANAYLGDEDQGQMSAWFIMAAIGLFQVDGGCRIDPVYELGSPMFEKIEIDLGKRYGRGRSFIIEAKNASRKNVYIQSAVLNGKKLNSFKFPALELLKGGSLILEMGSTPNKQWGIE